MIRYPVIDVDCIERCIKRLKLEKAGGIDGLVTEHVIHCHPSIIVHLKFLFTMMMTHSFVPDDFGSGVIIPIIKDRNGDTSSIENYKPITLITK